MQNTQTRGEFATLVAAEAIDQHRLVKINSSGQAAICGVHEDWHGVNERPVASGDAATIRLRRGAGTVTMTAAGAIARGDRVYTAASGKINDVVSRAQVGVALEAATADGDRIEVAIVEAPPIYLFAEAHTASDTLVVSESGTIHTNEGAAGAVTFTLPAATPGLHFKFLVLAAQELRLDPSGTETIALPSTGVQSAAGKYIVADAVGEWVEIVCVTAGDWQVTGYLGTWTAEA